MGILTILLSAIFWRLGGQFKGWIRDTLVPILIGGCFAWEKGTWWFLPLLAGSYQIIRLGYGVNSPLKKVFKVEPLVRGLYGAICACVGALPLVVATHLWLAYLTYTLLCFSVMATVVWIDARLPKANVWMVEIASGASIASIVFFM